MKFYIWVCAMRDEYLRILSIYTANNNCKMFYTVCSTSRCTASHKASTSPQRYT